MNANIRKRLAQCKRRIERRLDKNNNRRLRAPMLTASNIHYEIADRTRAIAAGGIGMIHLVVERLGLDEAIDRHLHVAEDPPALSRVGPRAEHRLQPAGRRRRAWSIWNCVRNDEVYLDALGARRIPDPDHGRRLLPSLRPLRHPLPCRRRFNDARLKVWRQQPEAFFDEAIIEADGTMVETDGECKQGMDINYKGQWGYHPLLISLANTGEPLYLRQSQRQPAQPRGAADYFDQADRLVSPGRVPQDPAPRRHRLHADGASWIAGTTRATCEFVFGIDAMPNLYELGRTPAGNRLETAASPAPSTKCKPRRATSGERQGTGRRGARVQEHPSRERARGRVHVLSRPSARRTYRVVVVWKDLEVTRTGRRSCSTDARCFFYITNDREAVGRRDRLQRQRPLQPGEPDPAAQERRACADGSGGQPCEQLGLHGHGLAGLEPEGLGGAAACPRRPLANSTARKSNAAADGLCHVSSCDDPDPGADRSRGRRIVYRSAVMEPLATRVLPPARSTAPAARC